MTGEGNWCGRIVARISVAFCVLVFCCELSVASVTASTEGELRAAIIVAIMRFTVWPNLSEEQKMLNLCLAGKPMSEDALMTNMDGQMVASRSLSVFRVQGDISHCQVLAIGSGVREAEFETLSVQSEALNILTICDGCRRGLGEESIIHLKLRQQRISFEVNLVRAKKNDVALDAQLLELASVVRK